MPFLRTVAVCYLLLGFSCADAAEPQINLTIQAPPSMPYQQVVDVLHAARSVPISKIKFSVAKESKQIVVHIAADADTPAGEVTKLIKALKDAGPVKVLVENVRPKEIHWQKFTAERLKKLRAKRAAVLVFCHADWCAVSKVTKLNLFGDKDVIAAVDDQEIVALSANLTHEDAARPAEMAKAGAVVPTLLIYRNGPMFKPTVLQGLVKKERLIDALSAEDRSADKE